MYQPFESVDRKPEVPEVGAFLASFDCITRVIPIVCKRNHIRIDFNKGKNNGILWGRWSVSGDYDYNVEANLVKVDDVFESHILVQNGKDIAVKQIIVPSDNMFNENLYTVLTCVLNIIRTFKIEHPYIPKERPYEYAPRRPSGHEESDDAFNR